MKYCYYCEQFKDLSEFGKNKSKKDGVATECKECKKIYDKIGYNKNKKSISIQQKDYYLKNKEIIKKRVKTYQDKNSKKIYKSRKAYLQNYMKEYRLTDEYKIKTNIRNREYYSKKYKTDIKYKIMHNLRTRLNHVLKRNSKSASTIKLLGCSIEFLKKYLEEKFMEGMNWDNHGSGWNGKGMEEWHIDHIRPCASFDLSKPEEQSKCFHYSNLQPLWATHNLRKSYNYER